MPSFADAVAEPMTAPKPGQSEAPLELFSPRGFPVGHSADLTRVLNLPRRQPVDLESVTAEAMIEIAQEKYGRENDACICKEIDPEHPCITRLLPIQAVCLHEISKVGGLIAAASTGSGKSAIWILSALALPSCKLALLLVPPTLIDQIIRQYQMLSEHFRVPSMIVHANGNKGLRKLYPGEPILHVISYNRLSTPNFSAWLDNLEPDLIIADECFPGSTLVETNEGPLPISEIVNNGRASHVLAFDITLQTKVWRRITNRAQKPGLKNLVRITHEYGTLTCTEDHKIYTTNRGYVRASQLRSADVFATTVSPDKTSSDSMRAMPDPVQAEGRHKETLFEEMRAVNYRCETCRTTHCQSRRTSGNRDPHMPLVPERISGCGPHQTKPLQRILFEEENPTTSLYSVRHYVRTLIQKPWCLWGRVRQEVLERDTTSKARSEYQKGLYWVSDRVQHVSFRQVNDQILLPAVCDDTHTKTDESAVALLEAETRALRFQQERRNPSCRARQDERTNVFVERWQRTTNEASDTPLCVLEPRGISDGMGDPYRRSQGSLPQPTPFVQGGLGDSRGEPCDRGGRKNPPNEEVEILGPPQDRCIELSRVVGVEVLEQRGHGGNGSSGCGDPVYDLTVEIDHNYFADGVLVSNCDAVSDLSSTRTKRLARTMESGRLVHFIGGTGSLMDKSITEFDHLMKWALREKSPLPLVRNTSEEWARCIDASDNPSPPGQLLRFCNPGEEVRAAFGRRLIETAGFIVTTSSKVTTSTGTDVGIHIQERVIDEIPNIIQEALEKVRNFQRPDTMGGSMEDEELVDALAQAKCAQEVSMGCFLRWIFPRGEPVSVIKEWYAARKLWNSELREKCKQNQQYLDSPNLCTRAAMRAHGDEAPDPDRPEWNALNWTRWREVKDLVEPQTEAVRLHPFLVEDAATWGQEHCGIIWYSMVEFSAWLAEVSGLEVFGGGKKAGQRLSAIDGSKSIIVSVDSRGRGWDGLQYRYDSQLFTGAISSSRRMQQLCGRLHRRGQTSEGVHTWVYRHTDETKRSFEQALMRSEGVKGLLREEHKILRGWHG